MKAVIFGERTGLINLYKMYDFMKKLVFLLSCFCLVSFTTRGFDYQFKPEKDPFSTFHYWKWANKEKWDKNVTFENRDGNVLLVVKKENPLIFAPGILGNGRFAMKLKFLNGNAKFLMYARMDQNTGNTYILNFAPNRPKVELWKQFNKKKTMIATFHFSKVPDMTYELELNFHDKKIIVAMNGDELGQVKDDGTIKQGQCGFGTNWGAVIEMISCKIINKR